MAMHMGGAPLKETNGVCKARGQLTQLHAACMAQPCNLSLQQDQQQPALYGCSHTGQAAPRLHTSSVGKQSVCMLGAQADGMDTALLLLQHTAMAQHAHCCTQPWHSIHTYDTACTRLHTARQTLLHTATAQQGLLCVQKGLYWVDPAPARVSWQWPCPCALLLHSALLLVGH